MLDRYKPQKPSNEELLPFELLMSAIAVVEALPTRSRRLRWFRRIALRAHMIAQGRDPNCPAGEHVVERLEALLRLLNDPQVRPLCVLGSRADELFVPADIIVAASEAVVVFDEHGPLLEVGDLLARARRI